LNSKAESFYRSGAGCPASGVWRARGGIKRRMSSAINILFVIFVHFVAKKLYWNIFTKYSI
jgi:hypothetical protein